MFSRKISLTVLFLVGIGISCLAQASTQELTGHCKIIPNAYSSCPGSGGKKVKGDRVLIKTWQPANTDRMYISAHMQYMDGDRWLPVPTQKSKLGKQYTSPKHHDLRAYKVFGNTSRGRFVNTSLFVPYGAMALKAEYQIFPRRYVIRLWDHNNREIGNSISPEQNLIVENRGRTISVKSFAMRMKEPENPENNENTYYTNMPVQQSDDISFDLKYSKEPR